MHPCRIQGLRGRDHTHSMLFHMSLVASKCRVSQACTCTLARRTDTTTEATNRATSRDKYRTCLGGVEVQFSCTRTVGRNQRQPTIDTAPEHWLLYVHILCLALYLHQHQERIEYGNAAIHDGRFDREIHFGVALFCLWWARQRGGCKMRYGQRRCPCETVDRGAVGGRGVHF